jgi:isopenicillin N synthase-like dioxygenase
MGRSIPVIDVSNFEQRRAEITNKILAAASDVGFLQIVNHGIPQERINAMFAMSESFFALDDAVKGKYPMDKAENKGWEKLAQVRPSTGASMSSCFICSQKEYFYCR